MKRRADRPVTEDRESGQTLVEYVLVLSLVVLVAVVMLPLIFPPLQPGFNTVVDTLTNVVG